MRLLRLVALSLAAASLLNGCPQTPIIGYYQEIGAAAIAPDGKNLAFFYTNDEYQRGDRFLYRIQPDGSGLQLVAGYPKGGVLEQPSRRMPTAADSGLCTALAGRPVGAGMGYVPASLTLTPDGSCYAVLEKEGEHRLLGLGPSGEFRWAIDADARGLGCTDGDDRQDADLVAASPDGKRLALSGGLLLDADGKFVDYLLPLIPREHAYALSEPAWSPNGQQLAYIASGPAKGDQVVIFDLAARTSRFLPLSLKRQSRTNMLYPDTGLAWHPVTGQLAATGLGDDGETVQVALFDQAGVRQQAFSVAASPEQSRTGSTFQVLQLIFTPGGKNLEVVSTDRITAIDLENGAQRTVVSVNQLPRNKPIYAPVY